MSVSQKSLVGRQNGSVPIAGSGSTKDRMGSSRSVLVGDWIRLHFFFFFCIGLGCIIFCHTTLGTIPRCSRRSTFCLLFQFKRGERTVFMDFFSPQLIDSHINLTVNQADIRSESSCHGFSLSSIPTLLIKFGHYKPSSLFNLHLQPL